MNFFDEKEKEIIKNFQKSNYSLKSLQILSTSDQLKNICLEYLSSSSLVKDILEAKKLTFDRKIEIMKYLDQFKACVDGKSKGFKDRKKSNI